MRPEGEFAVVGGPLRRRGQFGPHGFDLGVGIADDLGGVHGGCGGDAAVERVRVEGVSDVIDRSRQRTRRMCVLARLTDVLGMVMRLTAEVGGLSTRGRTHR